MKIANALSNFLYDKSYFIAIFEDKIHIYRYLELVKITTNIIILKMDGFNLQLTGEKMTIIRMNRDELLITGNLLSVGKKNE